MIFIKNAGFFILSCILLSILIPLCVVITKNKPEREERIIIKLEKEDNSIVEIPLEEYVLCVLRREVPALYEEEALKAQAVAIRSYALRKTESNTHEKGDLCTLFSHCMAYMDEEEAKEKWGEKFYEYNEKMKKAVSDTQNKVLFYENQIANTVFFALSSGRTEDAADVWGGKVPYLVSVDSIEDVNAKGFESEVKVSAAEFKNKLKLESVNIESVTRTEGGSVKKIRISGKDFEGKDIRSIFGLRSANFEISSGEEIVFKVKGYGHGVGMSQNGANENAKNGMNFEEILAKYYPGTQLVDLFEK